MPETIKFKEVETIDFNTDLSTQGDRRLTLDGMASYLEIPDVVKRHWGIPFKHKPKGALHYKISITDSGKLKIREGGELLTCRLGDSSAYSAEGDFVADGNTNKFSVDFNLCPSAVEDYEEILRDDTDCTVIFEVAITCEEDETFETFKKNGEIKLRILEVRPKVGFRYTSICKETTYTMKPSEASMIGSLKVYHSPCLKCAPHIERADYTIHTIVEDCANEGETEYHEYPAALYSLKAGNHHESCNVSVGSILSVSDLNSGEEFEIPVLFAANSVMANPQAPGIVFKLLLRSNDKNDRIEDSQFFLKRNPCLTRLEAKLDTHVTEWDILASNVAPEHCPMTINPGATSNHRIKFRNTADAHPWAGVLSCVKVWGVRVSVEIDDAASKRMKLQNGKTKDDVVSLHRGNATEKVSDNDYVDLGPTDQLEMDIRFNSRYIKWIAPAPKASGTWIPVKITLSYNYIEDPDGKYFRHEPIDLNHNVKANAKRSFTYEVHLTTVSTSPWLCVDFGTSAIVAASASFDRGALNLSLINLNERKTQLLATAFPGKNSNEDEEGVLINSVLCLNPTPDMNHAFDVVTGVDADFKKYALILSPGDDVLNADYMAPNLKLLMGYDKIPNIFSVIQNTFQYAMQGFDEDGKPTTVSRRLVEDGETTELMRPEIITKIVYLQLFKHYLRTAAGNTTQRIERLVMTVPNTYTPLQLDFIRRTVREALPELRPEEFHLVSESDAVACYYLYKRNALLQNMRDANPSIFSNAERRVLIYDMGAGTLDLTLMQTTQEQNGFLGVKMLGKLGVSKAGNYLDYVLAQILVDAVAADDPKSVSILGSDDANRNLGASHLKSLVTTETGNGLGSSKERLALKAYIKEMKKCLNSAYDTKLEDLPKDNEIAKWASNAGIAYNFRALMVGDIRRNTRYDEYVKSITTDLLGDFERYVCQANPNFKLSDIDVVVFSGRSSQLMDIRHRVKDALRGNPNIYFVDLVSETSSTDIDSFEERGGKSAKLKTVVAEGAYHFINFKNNSKTVVLDSRKMFASFGIVQYDTTQEGHRIWTPFIIAQTPCRGEGIDVEECQSYIKVTREIDLNGNCNIDLIQSYSGDVAGCGDYSSNETISVLTSIALPTGTKIAKVEFTLYIEPADNMVNSIHLKIDNGDEFDVNPHVDIQRNIALRRSLWPVVFS